MSIASRIEALRAMADQDVSPNEAAIAKAKLAAMGSGDRLPPRRPPVAPAPAADWFWTGGTTTNSTGSTFSSTSFSFWFRTTGGTTTNSTGSTFSSTSFSFWFRTTDGQL